MISPDPATDAGCPPSCASLILNLSGAEHLRWDVRRKALMEVVRELDADILCLQEVDNYPHFWVKELSLLGYTGARP